MSNTTNGTVPLEMITGAGSMMMVGINREQYSKMANYLELISAKMKRSPMRGKVYYHIAREFGGGVIEAYPTDRALKIKDIVSEGVINHLRDLSSATREVDGEAGVYTFTGMTEEQYNQIGAELGAISTGVEGREDGKMILDFETGKAVLDDRKRTARLSGAVDREVIRALWRIKLGVSR